MKVRMLTGGTIGTLTHGHMASEKPAGVRSSNLLFGGPRFGQPRLGFDASMRPGGSTTARGLAVEKKLRKYDLGACFLLLFLVRTLFALVSWQTHSR